MKVLCFLTHAIMTLVLKTTLDASETGAFITLNNQLKTSLHRPPATAFRLTTSQVSSLTSKASTSRLLTPWSRWILSVALRRGLRRGLLVRRLLVSRSLGVFVSHGACVVLFSARFWRRDILDIRRHNGY